MTPDGSICCRARTPRSTRSRRTVRITCPSPPGPAHEGDDTGSGSSPDPPTGEPARVVNSPLEQMRIGCEMPLHPQLYGIVLARPDARQKSKRPTGRVGHSSGSRTQGFGRTSTMPAHQGTKSLPEINGETDLLATTGTAVLLSGNRIDLRRPSAPSASLQPSRPPAASPPSAQGRHDQPRTDTEDPLD